ncbi:MAG TPA: hypothetical protein VN154_09765 [Rhizomicrobium sp.]|nr:hypothetical protein [Rhizomicrobium sp.]
MPTVRTLLFAAAALGALTLRAGAQEGAYGASRYSLQEINFDMWCQEERHLPPERCDKRTPQDDADYRAYVAKIESYEIPYLQEQRDEATLNRVIIHNDPIDHPTQTSAPIVNQTTPPPPPPPPQGR